MGDTLNGGDQSRLVDPCPEPLPDRSGKVCYNWILGLALSLHVLVSHAPLLTFALPSVVRPVLFR